MNTRTITVEEDVFTEVDKLATGPFSHSDVIRKLLNLNASRSSIDPSKTEPVSAATQHDSIIAFVQSPEYRRNYKGIDKYLAVLSWLYKHRPSEFAKVENFRRGSRVHFARSQKAIEESGNGAIHAKRIPDTPVWALSTLDNRTKRVILADMLHAVGFQQDEIRIVVGTIPDSDRHHSPSIGDVIV